MSNDDWVNVVGKQKKPRTKNSGTDNNEVPDSNNKRGKQDKKPFSRIEELLSTSQIQSLISSYDDTGDSIWNDPNKNNNNNIKAGKRSTSKETEPKKETTPVHKPPKVAAKEKVHKVSVKPKFKDLDVALKSLHTRPLQSNIETVYANFPDNHLMVLKVITSYLNENLRVDNTDPVFADKSIGYPSNKLDSEIRKIIEKEIRKAEIQNVQHFYDVCLSNLAEEMNKGQNYLGTKVMLQTMSYIFPQVCIGNLARNAILRNSYQNRANIGLSILWALGQGGFKDLTVGTKVWQDVMIPIVDLKTYTKYVFEYLHKIASKSRNQKLNISSNEFLTILNSLTATRKVGKDLQTIIDETANLLIEKYVMSAKNAPATFTSLFKNIQFTQKPEYVFNGLLLSLINDPDCYEIWKNLYKNNIQQSVTIIEYSNTLQSGLGERILSEPQYGQFLADIKVASEGLLVDKKKVDAAKIALDIIPQVQEKVNVNKKKNKNAAKSSKTSSSSSSCSKCFLVTFLVLAVAGGLIAYDTHIHGGEFENSQTGQLLKKAGVLPYVMDGWTCTMKYTARGIKWTEANVPVYYQTVKETLGPYVEFLIEFSKILWNGVKRGFGNMKEIIAQKTPVVVEFIEKYAPGLPEKISNFSCSTWQTVSSFSVQTYTNSCEFFKTKVFVGQLSPESLSKALNTTQITAAQYYSWLHDKIDFYAKIE